jgi:O-antigen/teichoic acid export membrane protein
MNNVKHLNNFISVWIVSLLNLILPVVIILCLGRFYEVEEFGNYSVATSFMSAIAVILTFGLGNVISFEVAEITDKDNDKITRIIFSGVIVLLLFSILGLIIIGGLLYILNYHYEIIILIVLLGIGYWSMGATLVFNGVFMGLKEMHLPAISASFVLLTAIVLVIPSLYFHLPLWEIALTWSLSQAVGSVISLWFLSKKNLLKKPMINKDQIVLIIKRSLGIGLNNVISRFGANLIMILLPVYLTSYQIGIFSGAFKPFVLLAFSGECVMRFFSPYIAGVRLISKDKIEEYLSKMHRLVAFFTLTIIILPIFFANPLIKLFFGEKLLESARYMTLLGFGYLICYLPPLSPPLMALGMEWKVIWCSSIRLVVNLIGIILLVPKLGIMGAVISVNIAFLSYWLVTLILYVKENLKPIDSFSNYVVFAVVTFSSGILIKKWASAGLPGAFLFLLITFLISLLVYWSKSDKAVALSYLNRLKSIS